MTHNNNLNRAKAAKNDEFYTQYADIQKEMNAYLGHNPDIFRGKTVLLPCDDPEWSNFTKFFARNFGLLGLGKLISTSFAHGSKEYRPKESAHNTDRSAICGKILVIDRDAYGDGCIDINNLEWQYLEGTGDFRSEEVTHLRDEADIVITNPPFSLLREFISWLVESGKQFLILGNLNVILTKEVFPLLMEGKIWLGASISGGDREFRTPGHYPSEAARWRIDESGQKFVRVTIVRWLTNIRHGLCREPLRLLSMADNLIRSRHKNLKTKHAYERYGTYDAIEVPYTDAIPADYEGVMGVPITFLDKYCPEQFEIIGIGNHGTDSVYDLFKPTINGQRIYKRILIRKRKQNTDNL